MWRRVGPWNLAYVAFLVLLVPFAAILESGGDGRESGGGIMAALLLCGFGSLAFLLMNGGRVLIALAKGRTIRKPLVSCALSVAVLAAILAFESVP